MPPRRPESDRLPERLAGLPGLEHLREAAAGLPAYLVGGSVRDLLIGVSRSDLDVAVEGDVAPLAERLGGDARAHERFGTAKVRVNGLEIDLAATRGSPMRIRAPSRTSFPPRSPRISPVATSPLTRWRSRSPASRS
jgi:tRNA nucleotidyltransferase/poly(A) polymerase